MPANIAPSLATSRCLHDAAGAAVADAAAPVVGGRALSEAAIASPNRNDLNRDLNRC